MTIAPRSLADSEFHTKRQARIRAYCAASAVVALCSLLGAVSHAYRLTEANIVMIFLAGVALVAAWLGRGPAVLAAISSVLVFDFFFVEPNFSFVFSQAQYFITLAVMLGIGLLISALTAKLQAQLQATQKREGRTAQLYQMTRRLNESSGIDPLLRAAGDQLERLVAGEVVIYLTRSDGGVEIAFGAETRLGKEPSSLAIARCVVTHQRLAGGTDSDDRFGNLAIFVPMLGSGTMLGAVGVRASDGNRFLDPEERQMLETCAGLIALSIERYRSQEETHRTQLEYQQSQLNVQSEQLRNSLLASVSHDLRTPLATIAVTATSLLDESAAQSWPDKREILETVVDETHRLSRQVENLLEMARLNSGMVSLRCDWEAMEELIEAGLGRLRRELSGRTVRVHVDADLPPLWVSGELMEKVFVNLLENAIRYSYPHSAIEFRANSLGAVVEIVIADDGPGLPPGSEAKVFEKYFRGTTTVADGRRGIGLGLAICRSIVEAHGGEIRAANRLQGGAEFTISLPCRQGSGFSSQSRIIASDASLAHVK